MKDSNLEFSEDGTDFEQEENPISEAVEDLLLDKIDLYNVHNLKPKTKTKGLNLNKKTPLKSRTKTSSLKSSKKSASQVDRKSSSSLEILTDKIDSFEEILLRMDQSISDTNILFLESKAELISSANNSLVEFKVDIQSYVYAEVAKKTLTLKNQILQLENENKILREGIDKIKDDCEKEINETINVKCEEGLKNLTDLVNTLTEAKLNEVRQERDSTVSMVEDFKTKNINMFIDFKRFSDEKSDEISQELNVLNKSIEEMKRLQQSLSDKHKNIEVRQNNFEQNLNFLQSNTNIEKNSVSAKDVEEIVFKVINSNFSNKPNVEIVTNTQRKNNGLHVHKVDHTVLSNGEKLQKCDVALLMDSNRKFIRKKFLFPSQYVYIAPCSTIQSAEQILLQPKFHDQHTINNISFWC